MALQGAYNSRKPPEYCIRVTGFLGNFGLYYNGLQNSHNSVRYGWIRKINTLTDLIAENLIYVVTV